MDMDEFDTIMRKIAFFALIFTVGFALTGWYLVIRDIIKKRSLDILFARRAHPAVEALLFEIHEDEAAAAKELAAKQKSAKVVDAEFETENAKVVDAESETAKVVDAESETTEPEKLEDEVLYPVDKELQESLQSLKKAAKELEDLLKTRSIKQQQN